jgi:hypothetical protein
VAKIREDAPFDKVCYIGCGVTTGIGAVINTAKVEPGANVVVFGLGGIGLNVIQGARMVGADKIIGVDLNPARKALAEKFGMTHFVNPKEVGGDLVRYLAALSRRRRRLQLRVHRQRQADAPGAGMLPSRLGQSSSSASPAPGRRSHAAVPAGHRAGLEGHRLRRRARPHRRAEDRRLVHGRQDQHRRSDHPHDAARRHQRGVRPDAPASRSAAWCSGIRWAATARWSARCAIRSNYKSVSAFAPIAAPMRCPWGRKAFGAIWVRIRKAGASTTPASSSHQSLSRDHPHRSGHGAINSHRAIAARAVCRRRGDRASRSIYACSRDTTTAITSSRVSWPITCAITPRC